MRKSFLLGAFFALLPGSGLAQSAAPTPVAPVTASSARRVQELPRGVRLEAEGDVSARHTASLPVGKGGASIPVQTVVVNSGRADVRFAERSDERGLMLQGPDSILGISTKGRLLLVANETTVVVAALESDAMVGIESRFKPLVGGTIRIVDRKTKVARDEALLAAPSMAPLETLHVTLGAPLSVPLSFSAVPGALGYVARVEKNGEASETRCATPEACSIRLEGSGSQSFTLRAVDAHGIEGRSVPTRTLRTVELVSKTRVLEGSLSLEPGELAEFAGTEGLLVRYAGTPDKMPAARLVGLPGKKATSVHFIDPADPEHYAIVPLQPRIVTAAVELGPTSVRWPDDDVLIRVDLRDGNGKPLGDVSPFRAEVTVNGAPVALDWSAGPGALSSTLAPQPGSGPWIVRVRVKNGRGVEIERDFLEVESSRPAREKTASR